MKRRKWRNVNYNKCPICYPTLESSCRGFRQANFYGLIKEPSCALLELKKDLLECVLALPVPNPGLEYGKTLSVRRRHLINTSIITKIITHFVRPSSVTSSRVEPTRCPSICLFLIPQRPLREGVLHEGWVYLIK